MSIELELGNLTNAGQVAVNIQISTAVSISAEEARRRATRLVASELGNLLRGGAPTLVIGALICWRVPILLATSNPDSSEIVGSVDIDANSGSALVTDEQLATLKAYAIYIAERAAGGPA